MDWTRVSHFRPSQSTLLFEDLRIVPMSRRVAFFFGPSPQNNSQTPHFVEMIPSNSLLEVTGKLNTQVQLGDHLIIDLSGCNQQQLLNSKASRDLFFNSVQDAGLTIVSEGFYEFSPYGFTCFLLLSESHASLHVWPEFSYCAIDLFTCNLSMDLTPLVESLQRLFQAAHCSVRRLDRLVQIQSKSEMYVSSQKVGEGSVENHAAREFQHYPPLY